MLKHDFIVLGLYRVDPTANGGKGMQYVYALPDGKLRLVESDLLMALRPTDMLSLKMQKGNVLGAVKSQSKGGK